MSVNLKMCAAALAVAGAAAVRGCADQGGNGEGGAVMGRSYLRLRGAWALACGWAWVGVAVLLLPVSLRWEWLALRLHAILHRHADQMDAIAARVRA